MKTSPFVGLGGWVWQLGRCFGADKDPQHLIERCQKAGIRWLTFKSGEAHSNGQITKRLVDALHAAGLQVGSWNYSWPGADDAQIAQIQALYALGVDGHFLDAEIEWETRNVGVPGAPKLVSADRRPEAVAFCQKLRAAIGPDRWLAHAPWWAPDAHPLFPWQAFGEATDAQCPQVYWTMQSGLKAQSFFDSFERRWGVLQQHTPSAATLVSPIASTFDGDNRNGVVGGQKCSADDVALFLDRCERNFLSVPFWSIYSVDACPPEVWGMLDARAEALRQSAEDP